MTSEPTYSFACGDVLEGCPATFEGSRDDVLAQVSGHAAAQHGISEVTPEVLQAVLGNLRAR